MNRYYSQYGGGLKGRKYVGLNPTFGTPPWFAFSKYSRNQICLINHLLSNHSKSRAHLASKGFLVDESCDCGQDRHTLEHLLYDCVLYNVHRQLVFDKLVKHNLRVGMDVCTLVNYHRNDCGLEISKFFIDNKIDI